MGTTGGITPLQQAFQGCLADNQICDESERGAVEPAFDEAIRTDLSSIPQTLNWLYQESKGTVSEPIQRLIEQKLTAAYTSQLLAKANDANGLLPDEFAAIYDDAGLQKLMNRFGAGAINLFLSNVIALAGVGTKIYIEPGVLTYCEAELTDDGVNKDSIAQYKALGITKPEPARE
ncbi:MAG: hypothetical protein HY542_05365, partial [Deltaproteobacteria bacterium]|nr:hypothetical protein [Deltaproteobacteria bacterium]